jgi:hypothetical protein
MDEGMTKLFQVAQSCSQAQTICTTPVPPLLPPLL